MKSKTAIVTGGAKRIGKALISALHQAGFDVAIHFNHSSQDADALAQDCNLVRPDSAHCFQAELTNADALQQLANDVQQWRSNISVLINNASMFLTDEQALLNWQALFDCNIKAPYQLSHLFAGKLAEQQGTIINITDIHALTPLADYDIYGMTKAALTAQTYSLAKKFAPDIRVNAIAPGAMLWPEHDNELDEKTKEKIVQQTPLKMTGGTEPIVKAAQHFIDNPFITGTILPVDGGRSL